LWTAKVQNLNDSYPRVEPEPARSVQRVTAVRGGRKERCVKKGSEMAGFGGEGVSPVAPRPQDDVGWVVFSACAYIMRLRTGFSTCACPEVGAAGRFLRLTSSPRGEALPFALPCSDVATQL
jgi:hypothetical protein